MSAILKIVPVREFDLTRPMFVLAMEAVEFAKDPTRNPYLTLETLERSLEGAARVYDATAAIPERARRASRWATHAELRKAIKAVGARTGCDECALGRGRRHWQGSISKYGSAPNTLVTSLIVNANVDRDYETFYCEGDNDLLHALADELAAVAGPQVAFSEDELGDPDALHVAVAPAKAEKKRRVA